MMMRLAMWIHKLKRIYQSDFAFRQDTTLAYLPLVIAFLTVLSVCMTHSAAYIKHVTLSGSEALQQRLHLHLPYDVTDVTIKQLYEELREEDGIDSVERVSKEEMRGFLGTWLGLDSTLSDDFPLPIILDITLRPEASRDATQRRLQYYISQNVNGALLESYDDSIAAFNQSSRLVKTGIYILGFVVMISTTLIVVIVSRINLGIHKRHIEILHDLGANDSYINRQFIKRSAIISLQGVVAGTLVSFAFIEFVKSRFDAAFLSGGGGELGNIWIYYLINPALLMMLVLAASWVSIEAQLKKMH
jgi:cell division transport system permease protein